MKTILKSFSLAVLVLAASLNVACTIDEVQESPLPAKDGKVFIKVSGQLGEFSPDNQTRSDLASVVRVRWANGDIVHVYDGTTCLGALSATVSDPEGRVAELSGEIDEPSGTMLSFIHSNMFSSQPEVSNGKIVVDLASQSLAAGKVPFVVYGFSDYSAATVGGLVVPFTFATSALTISVAGLGKSKTISGVSLSGVNTKCVLTLGDGTVTASGDASGVIIRTANLGSSNDAGNAFVKIGVPISAGIPKDLKVMQGTDVYRKENFSENAIAAGKSISVIVNLQREILPEHANNTHMGHGWVQLWPDGPVWATENIGASAPEGAGDFFAWGETSPKSVYNWDAYFDGDGSTFTKYYGIHSGFSESDDCNLAPEDDAAHVLWGGNWRIPTEEELNGLYASCSWEWKENYNGTGRNGYLITGESEGYTCNSIFIPATGFINGTDRTGDNYFASVWSSSLCEDEEAYYWFFTQSYNYPTMLHTARSKGMPIRPVCNLPVGSSGIVNGHAWVQLWKNGTKWATENIGAAEPTEYGDYYAWGETSTKDTYTWATYAFGKAEPFTKYNVRDEINLDPEDDVAQVKWGFTWRMPTYDELKALRDNCVWVWKSNYNGSGKNGFLISGKTGGYELNHIFLPAAGVTESDLYLDGEMAMIWSATHSDNESKAYHLYHSCYNDTATVWDRYRNCGASVRPVCQ